MLERTIENKTDFDLTSKSAFSYEKNSFTSRSFSALVAKNEVPVSHKHIADNYMVIKKVFKFQVCQSKISNIEKSLLDKYEFKTLDSMTMEEMYHELALLQKWAFVGDEELQKDSDEILEIRVKELKYLEASRYALISNEIYTGYKALDQYLREISKFRTANDLRTLNI